MYCCDAGEAGYLCRVVKGAVVKYCVRALCVGACSVDCARKGAGGGAGGDAGSLASLFHD